LLNFRVARDSGETTKQADVSDSSSLAAITALANDASDHEVQLASGLYGPLMVLELVRNSTDLLGYSRVVANPGRGTLVEGDA
jgi:hypothetical protein